MAQQAVHPTRRELRPHARHARPLAEGRAGGRARHASHRDDGFGRLLAWTTAGALVPGLGLLAAGRRRLGAALLALVVLGLAALAALAATGRLVSLGLRLAVRPNALLALAVVFVVVGLVWVAVIVSGHLALRHRRWRRMRLSTSQHVLAGALVAALVTAVAVPSATAARYAMTQRSLVLNVFDESPTPREPGLAAPAAGAADPWAGTPRINVLLLGSDAGKGRKGTRPDTLITASIDTQTGDAVLFSLPRNLERAPFPAGTPGKKQFPRGFYCAGSTECLINGVWTWAEANADLFPGTDEPGLTATRQVVGETLGIPIDYYALVNLQGFTDLVDAMGGVELTIPRRYPIGGLDGAGNKVKPSGYIAAGTRTLQGEEALAYARSRSDSTDYDRMGRQRCVIAAAVDQVNPVSLARAFPQLAASAQRNVETDIPASQLDAFVELGLRVQKGELRSLPFTSEVIDPADPDFELIRDLVQENIDPPPPPPASAPSSGTPAPGTPADEVTPTEPPVDPAAAQDTASVC